MFDAFEGWGSTDQNDHDPWVIAMTAILFEFVITRTFLAPRELVWQAWTEAERLRQWFGPKGGPIFHCTIDLEPEGLLFYGMKSPDGSDLWGKWVFQEVLSPKQLDFIVSYSNEYGGTKRHPWNKNWPLEIASTVTFDEIEGVTTVMVKWVAHNATGIEHKAFENNRECMEHGWGSALDQLDAYLMERIPPWGSPGPI